MKRLVITLLGAILALLLVAPAASAFSWKDVAKMHRAGVADSLILQKIEYSGETFHLGADELAALKEAGVSDEVVSAMLKTEAPDGARDRGRDEFYDDGYGDDAYYGYDGHPSVYPRSRIYVGFGWSYPYSYYDPFYWDYGGYWYPRYRTHYRSYYREPYRRVYTRPHGRNYGDHRYRGTVTPRSGATYRSPSHYGGGTSGSGTTRVRTQVSPRSGGVSGRTTTTRRR